MDFFKIKTRKLKNEYTEVYADFLVRRSKDLMVRAKDFYAIWDQEVGLWSTDEFDVQRLVDNELRAYASKMKTDRVIIKLLSDFSNGAWTQFKNYIGKLPDSMIQLDKKLTFLNDKVKRNDYVSKRLPYPMETGMCDAYTVLMETLYDDTERQKIEWAIGSVIAGDSVNIQKFLVLFGDPGSGKSTVLNIIQHLFQGYHTAFDADALVGSASTFSIEPFKHNPLVAIQHDADLSRIQKNGRLNSITSHEELVVNVKNKPLFNMRINAFLFIATNRPVQITDSKSGIIRRLIDVRPSGRRVPEIEYNRLVSQVSFELGAIADRCLGVYKSLGKNYYSTYKPKDMMLRTDTFFNFVNDMRLIFEDQDYTTLSQAWSMYKEYIEDAGLTYRLQRHIFRDELKDYWRTFNDTERIDGKQYRSVFSGFKKEKLDPVHDISESASAVPAWLEFDKENTILSDFLKDMPAQAAGRRKLPPTKWENNKTIMADIDQTAMHFVQLPKQHIVIDLDITDDRGEKSLASNIRAASKLPVTYAELSKSGKGIHLHYNYDGDVDQLSKVYDVHIEVLYQTGLFSLRRKYTKSNDIPIATINTGLPLKGPKMTSVTELKSERSLRIQLKRNLNKEIHANTTQSVNFIHQILEDAYSSGLVYDVTDMKKAILTFASLSTNNPKGCMAKVKTMRFSSEDASSKMTEYKNDELVFFDVEVFPNLFWISWAYENDDAVFHMINPTPAEVETLLSTKLIGFNNRRYDNHILYGAFLGYTNQQLFDLSSKIVDGDRSALFREAYGLSYTDVYDYSSTKQSLKKWELELGLYHHELDLPWNEDVPDEMIPIVGNYCDDDVRALKAVHKHNSADWTARLILSALSGRTPNDSTANHVATILFGRDKNHKDEFVYTDLSELFPGYKFDAGVSTYKGEEIGEGGYVYSEPGIYYDVAYLDIASMHPTSAEQLHIFGKYTDRYSEIKQARIDIKNGDLESAAEAFDGKLKPFLKDDITGLAYALKIIINIVYGLTAASFDNPFRDIRNKDNIVAKRGALYMAELRHYLTSRGVPAVHFKTDSVKIPNATDHEIGAVIDHGLDYGYEFGLEGVFDKMCLVNRAVLIGKWSKDHPKHPGQWEAVGAQFAHPYVFKTLFSKEELTFEDYVEDKAVAGGAHMVLDFNEGVDDETFHNYDFVGKVGQFVPIKPGKGGGILYRHAPDAKEQEYTEWNKDGGSELKKHNATYSHVSGTKKYRWMEAEVVKRLGREDDIDLSYYEELRLKAIETISEFGDAEEFLK